MACPALWCSAFVPPGTRVHPRIVGIAGSAFVGRRTAYMINVGYLLATFWLAVQGPGTKALIIPTKMFDPPNVGYTSEESYVDKV